MSTREKSNSGIGLDLLANQSKTKKSNTIFGTNQNINIDDIADNGSNGRGRDDDSYKFKVDDNFGSNIDDSKVNDLEKLNDYHNTFTAPKKSSPLFTKSSSNDVHDRERHYGSTHSLDPIKEKVLDDKRDRDREYGDREHGDSYRDDHHRGGRDDASYGRAYKPEMTEYEIRGEKREVYRKLQNLKDKGMRIPHFTEESDLDEMKDYYEMTSKDLRRRKGVKTMRKVVTTGASVIEFVFGKWNPLNVELEGWSESMNENITDFDDVFEEFAEKYFKDRSKLPVELRLVGLILWSALSFHFSNQMAKSMMNNGGKFMGMSMGDMGSMFGGQSQSQPQQQQQQQSDGRRGAPAQESMRRPSNLGGGQPASMNMPRSGGQQVPIREMRGPQGVDDIIKELREDLGEQSDGSDDFSVTSKKNGLKSRSKHR
jgi:hypothetical protein